MDLLLKLLGMFDSQVIEQVLFPVKIIVIVILLICLRVREGSHHMLTKFMPGTLGLQVLDSFKDIKLQLGDSVIKSRLLGIGVLSFLENCLTHVS